MKKLTFEYNFPAEQLQRVRALAAECGLHELTASILYSRGIDDAEKVKNFLHPSKEHFLSPFLMRGMRELKEEIDSVRDRDGLIAVYGDYDADGIGASAILLSALRRYGVRCVAHIPERAEGYGMSVAALEKLIGERSPDLIVTVDCGISNREEVEYIKSRGVRVIVTDHHELPDLLPDCVVVNPKLDDDYPYDNLCGAGVAFKIACALLGSRAYEFLDLAAVSTVADSVPLVGENRDIVFEGLRLINRKPRRALALLLAGRKDETSAQTLAFTVAPRVNAAGRMGDANSALRLFTSEDEGEIYDLSCRLNAFNTERQQLCDEVYRSAREKLKEQGAFGNIIMLSDESWNTGLVGIVAARICEEFNRPAILFVKKGDCLKGSARTIENINIYEALKACSAYIEEFGGHAQAAGVNVREENFEALKNALDAYIGETYSEEDFVPTLSVCDAERFVPDLALAKELELLEPYGVGNKRPLFAMQAGKLSARRLKQGSPHISVRAEGAELVWFGGESALPVLSSDLKKTLVFECGVSRFRGSESLRGIVKDMVCEDACEGGMELQLFRAALLRLKGTAPALSVTYESEESIIERIRVARAACRYGLLVVCSREVPQQFEQVTRGLQRDVFRLSLQNVGNAVLVCPVQDADVSMYRDILFLDKPADFNIASLAGKKIVVNRELCGYNDLASLETSREVMGEIYRCLRGGAAGEDSVACALSVNLDFAPQQVVFAIEVFAELGLLRFDRGSMTAVSGKRSELGRSQIYRAVCALKESQ